MMPPRFTGTDTAAHVCSQLAADVRKLTQPLPIVWDLLTDVEIRIRSRSLADAYWYHRDRPNIMAIEIPDIEFDPETGFVTLPGNRFGVLVLQ